MSKKNSTHYIFAEKITLQQQWLINTQNVHNLLKTKLLFLDMVKQNIFIAFMTIVLDFYINWLVFVELLTFLVLEIFIADTVKLLIKNSVML